MAWACMHGVGGRVAVGVHQPLTICVYTTEGGWHCCLYG